MERESFIFYASFYNAIKEIPNENQLKVYQAITNFALNGVEPTDLNGIEKAVFILVKPQIIANNKRYINGCGGGRPKKEEKTKKKNTKKNNGYENKKPNQNQSETETKPNENVNVKENVNVNENDNVNDKQIGQPKQPVAIVPKKTPQQRIFDYFANRYKALTGFKYKSKSSDFVNLAKLLKDYKEEEIIQKIEWLEVGCKNRVFWFAKTNGIISFTVGKLFSQWNEILPQYTAEQLKAQEERKKEEEQERRVQEELAKDELSKGGFNGCNNERN